MRPTPKCTRIFWGLAVALALAAGSVCLLFFLPYDQLKPLADHFSRHGQLASFTLERYIRMASYLRAAGVLLAMVGAAAIVFHRRSQTWTAALLGFLGFQLRATWKDGGAIVLRIRSWRPGWQAWVTVVAVTLVAAFTRLAFVNRPFQHDEAYTFEAFAVRPFSKIITDYSLPNNHILHTIFVRVSYLVFGNAPLAVRLPALLAGVLMAPLTYFVARRLYNRNAAMVSAALVAVAPVLIGYSTDARGYTLLSLITLGCFGLGIYVLNHKNRAAWLALSVVSALGFYTLPIMLYPYGILMVWLFGSALMGDQGQEYTTIWSMLRYLVISGLLTVVLTILLYTPIFIYSGLGSVFSNVFVGSLDWVDFRQTLPVRLLETWQDWTFNVPELVAYILAAGVGLSLVFHRKISQRRFPIQASALIWMTAVMLIQRPNPWARVWLYLFAPVMIWASAGLLAPFQGWGGRWKGKIKLDALVSGALALAILGAGVGYGIVNIPEQNAVKDIEASAIFLSSRLQPMDRIAMDYPMDVPFWYYSQVHGIPQDAIFNVERPYDHVYVIVNTNYSQTVLSVLATRAKDGVTCNTATIQKIKTIDYTEIYECNRH